VAKKREAPAMHHAGLNAFEDRSPSLLVTTSAQWNAEERTYSAAGPVKLQLTIEGPRAARFNAQPGRVSVYVDDARVVIEEHPASPVALWIPAERLQPGQHRIAVNWGSD
jgi:hypothetical protein